MKKSISLFVAKLKTWFLARPVKTQQSIKIGAGVLAALIVLFSGVSLIIRAGTYTIKNLQVTNLSGKSATITWETDDPVLTKIRVREGRNFAPFESMSAKETYDDRDTNSTQTKRRVHYVTLSDLKPSTQYYFSIGSQLFPIATDFNSLITFEISSRISSPQPIFGQIGLAKDNHDYSDIVVHYFVHDPASNTFSSVYSAIPNSEGRWAGEVTSIRNKYGAMFFTDAQVAAMADTKDVGTAVNVLGIATPGTESFGGEGGESAAEYIQVSASNGIVLDTTFVPLTDSLTTEVISNFIGEQPSGVLGASTDIFQMYKNNAATVSSNLETLSSSCNYGTGYTPGTCNNTACPTGRNCAANALIEREKEKCLSHSSTDSILDCCYAGDTIVNGQCKGNAVRTCTAYGLHNANSCSNADCPTGRNCAGNVLSGASNTKCVSNSGGDYIMDCCPANYTIVNGVCVDNTPKNCSTYGNHTRLSCTNGACPSGRECAAQSLVDVSSPMCLSRNGSYDTIVDCCASGFTISNGKCVGNFPVDCNYGTYALNHCANYTCPNGRNCEANALTNHTEIKCVNRGASNDTILDCCAAGQSISNHTCVAPTTPTPVPSATPVRTPTVNPSCNEYKDYPINSCTNTVCPSGRSCAGGSLTGASNVKCVNRGAGTDRIGDCCAATDKIVGSACVPISGTPTPTPMVSITPTVSISTTPSVIVTPTPTQPPASLNGCVSLKGLSESATEALGQRVIDEQIMPYISSQSGFAAFPIDFVVTGSGTCSAYNLGTIVCGRPGSNDFDWLTNKLLFHEVMHQFKAKYSTKSPDTGSSELMASILETSFVRETCFGGEYTFYGLGDTDRQYGRKPDQIRANSALNNSEVWSYAITATPDIFTEPVVNRVIPGAWKYKHIYCSGFKQFASQYDPPGCDGDQLGNVATTFNVNLGIELAPQKINDFDNGQYRLDLKYKTLSTSHNETDVVVPVKLSAQNGCAAGDAQCAINNLTLPSVYVDKNNPNDPRYALNVSLNSDIKNDLNCWRTTQIIPEGSPSLNLNLTDMNCDYSFGNNPIGGDCTIADLSSGIVAPWAQATETYQSQPFSSSHPGVDVQGTEGSTLVAAAGGVVAYTRNGPVKDSIFFDSVKYGTKCEEGSRLNPSNWMCLCDWCPLDRVREQAPNHPDLCNAQMDCVARAEALQNASSDWVSDGALHRIYGNVVIIEHANHKTVYAHMSSVAVGVGDCVTAGQRIGGMGTSGSSSGPHIHFEIRANGGSLLNPSDFPCSGDKCGLALVVPKMNDAYQKFLGATADENPDFEEGPIDFTGGETPALSQGVYRLSSPALATKNAVVKDAASTPKFYIDTNKNKKFDVGEQELGVNIVKADYSQVAGLQDVSLSPNWNLASFNAISDTTLTTQDIAEQANLSGLKLEMASYESDKWVISALKQEGNTSVFYGNQYNLIPGKAFFLRTDAPGIYYNTGDIRQNINKELNLTVGWNFFSFSKDVLDASQLTSYSFLDKCQAAGIKCSLFSDYNGQLDNTVMVRDMLYGKDYPLVVNKGYIVKVDSDPGKIVF